MIRIVITEADYRHLIKALHGQIQRHPEDVSRIESIFQELTRAEIVEPENIPNDVVTLHSVILLASPATGLQRQIELVSPSEATSPSKVSVLSTLGIALIGRRVGSAIEFEERAGKQQLVIECLTYQARNTLAMA